MALKNTRDKLSEMKLSTSRANKLSRLTAVSADLLSDRTLAQVRDDFLDVIDPRLLFFQRICGRVVKKDTVTGQDYPVPFATVHVEDTDCSFFAYTPTGTAWTWLYPLPFQCHREEIATVTTDACGNFCVWVPRFEIDWILQWIKTYICYPIRPRIIDILERIPLPIDPGPIRFIPKPDPLPYLLQIRENLPLVLEKQLGRDTTEQLLSRLEGIATFGAKTSQVRNLLEAPAFAAPPPPPMAPDTFDEFKMQMSAHLESMKDRVMHQRTAYTGKANLGNLDLAKEFELSPSRFIGPFMLCKEIYLPIFKAIFDVPDITFRVTQDVDSDGDEELIYAENFFDVRWNAESIPDVTLYAWEIAQAGVTCDVPPLQCSTQAIERVGFYPVNVASYHNNTTGYAVRPNRPNPSGLVTPRPAPALRPLSEAPFSGTLHLYGCNNYPGANYYRLRYNFRAQGSSTWIGPVSFKYSWPLHRNTPSFQTLIVTADGDGWYEILPDSEGWWPEHLLMRWPATAAGQYDITLEFGNASKNVIHTVPPIQVYVDNTNVNLNYDKVEWCIPGVTAWEEMSDICPVVRRPAGKDIQVRVTYSASAQHFRSVTLSAYGCGAGTFTKISGLAQHWHINSADNYWTEVVTYSLPSSVSEGSYRFMLHGCTRAFTPNDVDNGGDASVDWLYDPCWIDRYSQFVFSLINL